MPNLWAVADHFTMSVSEHPKVISIFCLGSQILRLQHYLSFFPIIFFNFFVFVCMNTYV